MTSIFQKYLQYSKRIAIFGICQWSVIALIALILTLYSSRCGLFIDEWMMRTINNIVTCSSALAVAICSGYYAHSAYDNNLKQKMNNILTESIDNDVDASGNG